MSNIGDNIPQESISKENFLFVFKPTKPDEECLCSLSLKNGVRIIGILVLVGSFGIFTGSFNHLDWFDTIWDLLLTIAFLIIGIYSILSTINMKIEYATIGCIAYSIVFYCNLIKCILEGALMLLSFINPFGEDFFRVKTVLYLLGEGIGLIVDIYLIWIVYCFMISLKKK